MTAAKNSQLSRRAKMPRPPKGRATSQQSMLGPFRHIEHEIEAAYWDCSKSNQKKLGELLYAARELIRQAGDLHIPSKG